MPLEEEAKKIEPSDEPMKKVKRLASQIRSCSPQSAVRTTAEKGSRGKPASGSLATAPMQWTGISRKLPTLEVSNQGLAATQVKQRPVARLAKPVILKPREESRSDGRATRAFRFGEFFSGMGGFSSAVEEVVELAEVMVQLDGWQEAWNILQDEAFEKALEFAAQLDHGHFAPPCRNLTMARRTDGHGCVPQNRSWANPEGHGEECEKANKVVERVMALCLVILKNGGTISVENPWWSFLWYLPWCSKILKFPGMELFPLDQCAYGAPSQKTTGILSNAVWMKGVKQRCWEVRAHRHEILEGHCFDYVLEKWVWRTSLAAEYPCGLCWAWATSLKEFLASPNGKQLLMNSTFFKVGKFGNVLIRGSQLRREEERGKETEMLVERTLTNKAQREEENLGAVGGLRDPARAVGRSKKLQRVGLKIRKVLLSVMTDSSLKMLETEPTMGFEERLVKEASQALCKEFGVDHLEQGFQVNLIHKILREAEDPDAEILKDWLMNGFPLGIECKIQHSGVFPVTEKVSASIAASKASGVLLEDWSGDAANYVSFEQEKEEAQKELDRLVEQERALKVQTWEEVTALVGREAKLTKLACLVKTTSTGKKVRLVVDMRRSGINGLMDLKERVVLPRITDLVASVQALLKLSAQVFVQGWQLELGVWDFRDAFYMMKLRSQEKKYVVVKGADGFYYLMQCVAFGLACGPLLWGRLAAAAMRISQSAVQSWEGRAQCFVDDPILVVAGRSAQERSRIFCLYLLAWTALGFQISWAKAQRGTQVTWIGFGIRLIGASLRDIQIFMTKEKASKV